MIPELTQRQRDLMQMGLCPFCEKQIKGWKPAPEWYATVREHGRDPSNGHKTDCPHKEIRL